MIEHYSSNTLSTVFIGTMISSPTDNCSQWGMWINQSNWDAVSRRTHCCWIMNRCSKNHQIYLCTLECLTGALESSTCILEDTSNATPISTFSPLFFWDSHFSFSNFLTFGQCGVVVWRLLKWTSYLWWNKTSIYDQYWHFSPYLPFLSVWSLIDFLRKYQGFFQDIV